MAGTALGSEPPLTPPVNYAGRLIHFYNLWKLVTADPVVLSYIRGYKIPFARHVFQHCPPPVRTYSSSEQAHFDEAIEDLLSLGAISKCEPCKGQYLSSIFLVPKPNGKMRFILNLKQLNKFIDTQHFKLEDLRTALKLVSKDCFMAKLDLKDAYFLIKIHPDHRKYLRFVWNQTLYEFHVLPFGLSTAPYVFTKVMKPVAKLLRRTGLLSTVYLDDWLLIGQSFEDCLENVEQTKSLLTALGFIINEEKSCLTPSKCCLFLGYNINSKDLQVSLPDQKIHKINSEIKKFVVITRCTIRDFARLVGLLVSACPAVEYGWLYTKNFERIKFLNLKDNDNYNKYMNVPASLIPDLEWWKHSIFHSVCKIKDDSYSLEIFSDASTTGWGVACGEQRASGQWSVDEKARHINYLELLAAFFGIQIFAKNLSDCQVLLRIDNTTAISYINRMGGIQYPHLTEVTRNLWQWCEFRNLYVFASYIRSSDNQDADAESRRIHPDIEWELSPNAFQKIVNHFGYPDIDMFASRINNKCSKYISWHPDPGAYAVNAFTVDWSHFYFYAFPPFSVILKSLRKIKSDKAKGIMVVPLWPSQPWYPIFKKLASSDVLILEANDTVIISPHSSDRSMHTKITLAAAVLSGQLS